MITKQFFVLSTVVVLGIACQDGKSINERLADPSETALVLVNRRLFTEVPISNEALCGKGGGENCAEKMQKVQLQLMRLDPVPVPDQDGHVILSANEATARYRKFIEDPAYEQLAPIAKQLYPRILLNQYGILASKDYPMITYYTQQMVEANSLDFATLTTSLITLRNQIPGEQFSSLLAKVTKAAVSHKIWQEKMITSLTEDTSTGASTHSGTLSAAFMKTGQKRMLDEYKKSTIETDLARLRSLQGANID